MTMTEKQRFDYRQFAFLQLFQCCQLLPNHWDEITAMLRKAVTHIDHDEAVCPGLDGPHWHLKAELERLPGDTTSAMYYCPNCRALRLERDLAAAGAPPKVPELSSEIYFIYNPATALTKIGHTANVAVRKRALETELKTRVELWHHFSTNAPAAIEKQLHHLFKSKRHHGEWFALSEADLAAVRSAKAWYSAGSKLRLRIGEPEAA